MQEAPAPQVSIIVPVYNVEAYLRRCLNSIERQTLKAWECICVDDGSPDGCGAILDEYAARDARFVVIHQENGGVSRARNAGVEAARAEWIGFVDPDDWIESDMFEVALEAARRTGADIVQWGCVAERGEDAEPRKKTPHKERREGFFDVRRDYEEYFETYAWSKLFRSSLVLKNSIRFPVDVRRGQDASFSIASYALAQKCFYLNRLLYHYDTTRETSTCHNTTAGMFVEEARGYTEAFALIKEKRGDWRSYSKSGYVFWLKVHAKALFLAPPLFATTGFAALYSPKRTS